MSPWRPITDPQRQTGHFDYLFLPKRIVTNSETLIRLRFFKDGGVCYVIGFGRDSASSTHRSMLHRNLNKFRRVSLLLFYNF